MLVFLDYGKKLSSSEIIDDLINTLRLNDNSFSEKGYFLAIS